MVNKLIFTPKQKLREIIYRIIFHLLKFFGKTNIILAIFSILQSINKINNVDAINFIIEEADEYF